MSFLSTLTLAPPICVYEVVIKDSKAPLDDEDDEPLPLATERDEDSSLSATVEDKTVVDAVDDKIEDSLSNLRFSLLLAPSA